MPPLQFDFRVGETAYHRAAVEKKPGVVTCILLFEREVMYRLSWGDGRCSDHFNFELSREFTPDYTA